MNELRLQLLLLGLLLIVVLCVWEWIRRRGEWVPPRSRQRPPPEPPEGEFPVLEQAGGQEEFAVPPPEPLMPGETGAPAGFEGKQAAPSAPVRSNLPGPEPVALKIYLMAPEPRYFYGNQIHQVLEAAGMRYGGMQLFHRYAAEDSEQQRPLFSVANMYEPGVLAPEMLPELSTPGLVFFLSLPAIAPSPEEVWPIVQQMLDCAHTVAAGLQGQLWDEQFRPLDAAGIEALRSQLVRGETH